MIRELSLILIRGWQLAQRTGGSWTQGSIFFILFIMLAAFSLGPEQAQRANIAPALVWLAATLASQLTLDRLFTEDLADGTLENWVAQNRSVTGFVIGKVASHWLFAFSPVLLLAPLAAIMLGTPTEKLLLLIMSLIIGGPALVLFGAMAAALTANLRGSGLLVVLLSGPLLASPLIFGVGAVQAGIFDSVAMKMLGAISLATTVFVPVISSMALKVHLE